MAGRDDIERLAALLDGSANPEQTAEDRRLGALATMLREAQPEVPPMRAEFRSSLRTEVVAAAREQVVEPALLTRIRATAQRFKYSTGLAGATGMASVALAGGGVAGAAEHAQPGDFLYGTKLAIEDVRLAVTFDDLARGRRALTYAADRVEEARTAAAEADDDGVATALRGADDRNDEARDLILLSGDMPALLDFFDAVEAQTAAVLQLSEGLSGDAAAAAQELLIGLAESRDAIGTVLPGVLELPPPAPSAPAPTAEPPGGTAPAPVVPDGSGPAGPDVQVPPVDPPLPTVQPGDGVEVPDVPDLPEVVPPPVDLEPSVPGGAGVIEDAEGLVDDAVDPLSGQ